MPNTMIYSLSRTIAIFSWGWVFAFLCWLGGEESFAFELFPSGRSHVPLHAPQLFVSSQLPIRITTNPTVQLHMSSEDGAKEYSDNPISDSKEDNRRTRLRKRVTKLARDILSTAAPDAVMAVMYDATTKSIDMAVENLLARRKILRFRREEDDDDDDEEDDDGDLASSARTHLRTANVSSALDTAILIDEAFRPVEESLQGLEEQLLQARKSLAISKQKAHEALSTIQATAIARALEGAVEAVEQAEQDASRKVLADIYVSTVDNTTKLDISSLAFEDVDYGTSEMAPPFLDEGQCLVPGEPVVRVEKAPENSRRIFAGVDIMTSVDNVWNVLTDYRRLQEVVPNLVVNEVIEEYPAAEMVVVDRNLSEDAQCEQMARQMKGSLLRQVGGAKVAGIQFSARTTLEVREWPEGLPDFAHFRDEVWDGLSRKDRAKAATKIPLTRYKFPRPFAVSKLPTRDISMQSVVNDDGEFRLYQGVWRMQPLPGCAPPGKEAMRLTYAVEVSPRAYLPVQLIEGRIVRDLCTNLEAIRDYLDKKSGS